MNTDWRKSVKDLAERIDALSLRERAIIFGGIMAILFMVAYNLIFTPMRVEQSSLEKSIKTKFEQTAKLHAEVQRLSGSLAQDPDAANRERIADLKARLATADEAMAVIARGLVSPKQTVRLVEQILATHRNVRVVRVENLPSMPLFETAPAAPATPPVGTPAPTSAAGAGLYRHGLRIEVRANYLDIIRMLRAMEALPSRLFWGEVSIRVEKYPISHATVVMYTLNQDSTWFGI